MTKSPRNVLAMLLLTITTFAITTTKTAAADELVLVRDGVSQAPIIVYENAPPLTRQAVDDLADYIEKVSGARPEVIEGAPDSIPTHAIWVGVQPGLNELFPQIDFEFQHPEEILIAANENHLVIAGRDRWDPDHLVVPGYNTTIHGKQQEYGTANAIYTFLHRYLQVVWLWPGELGEDIIEQPTLAFAPFTYRYHPQFRQRSTLFRLSKLGDTRGWSQQWTRFQRLQLDSLLMDAGHAFTDWWSRFHQEHREYFAVQPNGERNGYPAPAKAKLDQSNPDVWDQWLADVKNTMREQPTQRVFNAAPNDSALSGICFCDNCLAWDPQPGEAPMFNFDWQGGRKAHVAMSDRYVTFANHLARKLKNAFPDRELYVKQSAYHSSTHVPVKVKKLEDNIIISYVGYFPTTSQNKRQAEKAKFQAWAEIAPQLIYRPNMWVHFGSLQLPHVAMQRTIEDFRFLAENRCIGITIDTIWESWATMGPQYYLMAQLTWDPRQDGQAVLDEYYQRGFGEAAEPIKAYWRLVERETEGLDYHAHIYLVHDKVFGDTFFNQAKRLLDQAAKQVEDGPEKYRRRVAFVLAGLEYTQLIYDLVSLMPRNQTSDETDINEAKKRWATIEQITKDHPWSIDYRWARRNANRRGMHLVPAEQD